MCFQFNPDYSDYKKAISQKQTFFLLFFIFRFTNRVLGNCSRLWYINSLYTVSIICTITEEKRLRFDSVRPGGICRKKAYAEKKYHIREQRKWSDFPGFSVLADPETEKWVALLIRQKDFSTGANVERCDIKCGRQTLQEISASFLSPPFRMKGQKWVGVTIDRNTDPDVVFRLLDRAVTSGASAPIDADIPEPIGEMLRLYEYGDGSFRQKCENFYRQGKFMEQYEDNAPWTGQYLHYFPTYHDLNLRQLRGYFTWRTHLRKGEYPSSATSFAFLYLYELLNEIGTSSPEDSLRKMRDFETGYLDSGIGDPGIRKNLHRWMLEFSVVRNIPLDSALLYIPREDLEADRFLAVLKMPEGSSDDDLFSALFYYSGKKETSSVYPADLEPKRKHLVADACGMHVHPSRERRKTCFLPSLVNKKPIPGILFPTLSFTGNVLRFTTGNTR